MVPEVSSAARIERMIAMSPGTMNSVLLSAGL